MQQLDNQLLREGIAIQKRLQCGKRRPPKGNHKQFGDAMKSGKVGTAISVLTQTAGKGCLPLDEITNGKTVKEHLLKKHPSRRPLLSPAIEGCQPKDDFHPVLFDAVDGSVIRKCALKLRGAAGPSYADSTHWKRMFTEHRKASDNLCNALATVTGRLCLEYVDPSMTENLRDCRLIPFDKNPGIRPIGICEVLRRLIGKAALTVLKPFIREKAGFRQLAAGHEAGCEAAIHSIRQMFELESCEGLLLVDAKNYNKLL